MVAEHHRGARAHVEGVFDFHTHVDDAPGLGLVDLPPHLLERLDEAGVGGAVCMTYRDATGADGVLADLAGLLDGHRDRLVGFARLDPRAPDAATLLEEAVEALGMQGLKLHPSSTGCRPSDPPTVALLRAAASLDLPVLFHSGDDEVSHPAEIGAAAAESPATTVVLGHMGGYRHVGTAIDVAERTPNCLLETSAMPYPDRIREAAERIGAARILFGSDAPRCNPAVEREKVRLAGLTAEANRLVLGGNAARILPGGTDTP